MTHLQRFIDWCWCTWVLAGIRREQEWNRKESMARIRWAQAVQAASIDTPRDTYTWKGPSA